MLKENEILDQVEAYVAGQIPLRHLSGWLYEATWDMAPDTHPRAQAFTYAVLGKLAEQSSAGFSEAVLRQELQRVARVRREELNRLARVIVRRMPAVPDDPVRTVSSSQIVEVPVVPVEP